MAEMRKTAHVDRIDIICDCGEEFELWNYENGEVNDTCKCGKKYNPRYYVDELLYEYEGVEPEESEEN